MTPSLLRVAALLLVCVVLSSASSMLTQAAPGDKAGPHLVVSKTVSDLYTVQGSKSTITVTVTVTNLGQGTAFDVQLTDVAPLQSKEGSSSKAKKENHKKSADKLALGESVSLTYTFLPTALGALSVPLAEATYATQAGGSSTPLKAYSNYVREELEVYRGAIVGDTPTATQRGLVHVLTQEEYDRHHASKVKEVIIFTLLAIVSTGFPYFLYRSKQTQVETVLRESKRK